MIMLPIHRRRRRARSPEPLETIDTSKRVDINHDRKRLVATIVLSLLVLAFCVGWLAIGLASPGSRAAHAHLPPVLSSLPLNRHEVHLPGLPTIDVYSLRESPWWSLELGLAALLALAGMLRNLYRL